MIGKKGQGIAIDFLFAVLVFLLVLNACITLIENTNRDVGDKAVLNQLNAKAAQAMDMLVRTPGQPNNWEQKSIDAVTVIGLAKRDRTLDRKKVEKFTEWAADYSDIAGDYNRVKSLLLIGYDYNFSISDSDGKLLAQAPVTDQSRWDEMIAVNVKRIVNFDGEEAIAEFTIYFPR